MKTPLGTGLLLLGSGIYWILSSQLIASFSALVPKLFDSIPDGVTFVLIVGVISSGIGLWIIKEDLDQVTILLDRQDGWVFLIPIVLVVTDLALTLIGLSSSKAFELNPLVSSAVQSGTFAFATFAVSYMALSEGLALLTLYMGDRLFPSKSSKSMPFAAACGAAVFGPVSNLVTLASPTLQGFSYIGGASGAILLATLVLRHFKRPDPIVGDIRRKYSLLLEG